MLKVQYSIVETKAPNSILPENIQTCHIVYVWFHFLRSLNWF